MEKQEEESEQGERVERMGDEERFLNKLVAKVCVLLFLLLHPRDEAAPRAGVRSEERRHSDRRAAACMGFFVEVDLLSLVLSRK